MNGIDKIIEKINADCDAEIAAINAEADARIAELKALSDKSADDEYSRLTARGEREAEQQLGRLVSAAELEAKKQLLAVKQEQVSLAFERAGERLKALPDDEYLSLLCSLAARASATGREQIALNKADLDKFGAAVADGANALLEKQALTHELTMAAETRAIDGGLIMLDGRIEVNCSIAVLLEQQRDALASTVARTLFN